ncbi:MAG: hypothetical protein ACTSPL_08255, partial [Candidatus Odinarchaeia archaeon]
MVSLSIIVLLILFIFRGILEPGYIEHGDFASPPTILDIFFYIQSWNLKTSAPNISGIGALVLFGLLGSLANLLNVPADAFYKL